MVSSWYAIQADILAFAVRGVTLGDLGDSFISNSFLLAEKLFCAESAFRLMPDGELIDDVDLSFVDERPVDRDAGDCS